MYGHFVGMENNTRLYRVFIPNTKKIAIVRKDDFKIAQRDQLPGISALLDGIARQVAEEEQGGIENSERQ